MNIAMSPFFMMSPELILLASLCVILCVDVCVSDKYRVVTYWLTQLACTLAFFAVCFQYQHYTQALSLLMGHYRLDGLALLAKGFIYVMSALSFLYAYRYITVRNMSRGDFYLLGLSAVLGMSVMASAESLLTIYLGLELLSLALYAMVCMQKDADAAVEAAMKYFVLGSLASGILLYGISIIYGVTGSIHLNVIQSVLLYSSNPLVIVALIFMLAGFIFKLGAVPFHMWVPDVYHGAPTAVTQFIASAPKVAAFVVLLRVLAQAMPNLAYAWTPLLIAMSIFSMGLGNLLAIAQTSVKRMLAYSSIGHMGYALLGVLVGPLVPEGYSAAFFYIVTYSVIAAGAFAVIAIMGSHGVELDHMDDYRGLNARHPWLAFMMMLLLFSMAGVPPTVGFFAKLSLLEALIQGGYVWLAVLALAFALIGAYYYLRLMRYMYFEEPSARGALSAQGEIVLSKGVWAAITLNGGFALVLGMMPNGLLELCRLSLIS